MTESPYSSAQTAAPVLTAAWERLNGVVLKTPLLRAAALDELAGRRVWVKPECLQHSGSFKFRGAYSAVSALDARTRLGGILAFSSGNHAQGVALAARMHGASATIIMPSDAPAVKIANTRALGAKVVLYDRATENREEVAALHNNGDMHLIKPFDDVNVIAGQSSVGVEIYEQAKAKGIKRGEVLVPCGGGGLSCGIGLAIEHTCSNLRVHPCEPCGFDDLARSLRTGQIETNANATGSICDALISPSPGQMTFPILKRLHAAGVCGAALTASDAQCLQAVALAVRHLRIVIEPGGAVALACALFNKEALDTTQDKMRGEDVIIVASGGNIDPAMLTQALQSYGADS